MVDSKDDAFCVSTTVKNSQQLARKWCRKVVAETIVSVIINQDGYNVLLYQNLIKLFLNVIASTYNHTQGYKKLVTQVLTTIFASTFNHNTC